MFTSKPGRLIEIINSPVAAERLTGTVRAHPGYEPAQAHLKSLLRGPANVNEYATAERQSPFARPNKECWFDRVLRHPNLIRLASVLLFLVSWEYFGRNVNPLFLVGPSRIATAAFELWGSGELPRAILQTSYPFLIGMGITIVGGILIGVAMAQWRFVEYTLDPFVNRFYAIPRIALVPLRHPLGGPWGGW